MRYKTVEVEVELSDFDDEDLIDELESRGKYNGTMGNSDELIDKIFQLRRLGKPYELDEYLYMRTGRTL